MKLFKSIVACGLYLFLSGCITDFTAKGISEEKDILVVEGFITEGESVITLRRSINLSDDSPSFNTYVENAIVSVECDDGTTIHAEGSYILGTHSNGQYTIKTGMLNPENKYGLKIVLDEHVYCSDYAYPIITPEIDSVFWMKKEKEQPVTIHVATHDPNNRALYYRWSFLEEWEILADIDSSKVYAAIPDESVSQYYYPYQCWNSYKSNELLIGSGEKTVLGRVTDILTTFSASNRKIEVLYRMTVKQNSISKRAYDYFENIKKNTQDMESLFAPTPSELRGNVICITNPDKPVIGFVDVSLTVQKRLYIRPYDGAYEFPRRNWLFPCDEPLSESELLAIFEPMDGQIPNFFVPYFWGIVMGAQQLFYVDTRCIDCTNFGTTNKPDDWP